MSSKKSEISFVNFDGSKKYAKVTQTPYTTINHLNSVIHRNGKVLLPSHEEYFNSSKNGIPIKKMNIIQFMESFGFESDKILKEHFKNVLNLDVKKYDHLKLGGQNL